ncbi:MULTISPECIES: preprotein translocase subunit SecG [Desulfofundulus]|uniref:Protein-export membrane protein SecG n=3 Tax=Desulfofundulus TaxID=2282741 RepID=A0A494WZ52_9FIRM|nr:MULTISPECIES: preprotein translocase subunit SecG [Desulfofundulus]MDQ0285147.1 preprotein translocase subunit SecG [Desulfofundulus luciae]RKO65824.1 preprotein translocase subunit SecG [Desulfofundulus salinum]SHI56012.1 preprotein translocase subunit SecG [Desulfofundulus thermosubterraneus DSM 16057]
MLKGVLIAFHVLLSIALIATVLLQSGRSAGLSGAIAGGAEVLFGKKKGLDEFFSKLTTVVAVLFAITSLVLGLWI